MTKTPTGPDGQYASNLEDIRDKDTPKIKSADTKKQEEQMRSPVIYQPIQINQYGFFCFMTGNIGTNSSKCCPPTNPPPNKTGWQKKRALHMIKQVAIWIIRFASVASVIVDFLDKAL